MNTVFTLVSIHVVVCFFIIIHRKIQKKYREIGKFDGLFEHRTNLSTEIKNNIIMVDKPLIVVRELPYEDFSCRYFAEVCGNDYSCDCKISDSKAWGGLS